MITINVWNFGGIIEKSLCLDVNRQKIIFAKNGTGKTSLVNAIYWVFTGQTLYGFVARKKDAGKDLTHVSFVNQEQGFTLDRVLYPDGKIILTLNDNILSQSDLEACVKQSLGLDMELVRACCNPLVLAKNGLTTEDLQRLLAATGVLEGNDLKSLKRKQKQVRSALNEASKYALTNVHVPVRCTVEPTKADRLLVDKFTTCTATANIAYSTCCECCGQTLPTFILTLREKEIASAREFVDENNDAYKEALERINAYDKETGEIEATKRLLEVAKKARADVEGFEAELLDIQNEITALQENSVNAALPDGVMVITEETLKNGNVRPCCKLLYEGLPLSTVNYAKRVEICTELVSVARTRAGAESSFPILIDNAESVTACRGIPCSIRFEVTD